MALYNADGQINLTVTDGTTLTGAQAPDGSYYIVLNDGTTYTGYRHPCGAVNAVVATEETASVSHPNGSAYVAIQSDGVGYTFTSSLGSLIYTPTWVLSGAAVDADFANSLYYGGTLANLLSTSRASTGYAETVAGTLTSFATNTPRITDKGLLVEEARTNVVLWNRDLTNAAWTASNVTVAKDQAGVGGTANSASSLTATAGNGTVLQAITLASSARFQSAYVKRITGSGVIEMTMDNGTTWTAITVTASYTQLSIPTQTLANPTVGFRIVTSGDAIAVDMVQNENGAFKTSPIPTTTVAVTRAADNITGIGALLSIFQSGIGSAVFSTRGSSGAAFNSWLGVNGTSAFLQQSSNITNILRFYNTAVGNLLSISLGSGTTLLPVKAGISFDASNRSGVANNGIVATAATPFLTTAVTSLSIGTNNPSSAFAINGYIDRITAWNTRLADATLKGLTA